MRLQSLVATSAFAFAPGGNDASCRALDVAWVGDCAVAVLVKQQYPGGHATRQVFVFSAGGHAAEVLLDDDEPCQLAPELDGCVVLGEHTWTLVRDVPMAVQRVRRPSGALHLGWCLCEHRPAAHAWGLCSSAPIGGEPEWRKLFCSGAVLS